MFKIPSYGGRLERMFDTKRKRTAVILKYILTKYILTLNKLLH